MLHIMLLTAACLLLKVRSATKRRAQPISVYLWTLLLLQSIWLCMQTRRDGLQFIPKWRPSAGLKSVRMAVERMRVVVAKRRTGWRWLHAHAGCSFLCIFMLLVLAGQPPHPGPPLHTVPAAVPFSNCSSNYTYVTNWVSAYCGEAAQAYKTDAGVPVGFQAFTSLFKIPTTVRISEGDNGPQYVLHAKVCCLLCGLTM